jgi:hypothetical protein
LTGLGTSQRRSADDGSTPEGGAGPERQRNWQLWPPEISWDPGPLAVRARAVAGALTPAALWRNHRLFTVVACVSVIPRVIAALGFKPALLIQDSFSYLAQGVHLTPLSQLRPAGYPLVLRVLEPFHSLLLVTTLQHLMGIGLGAIIYGVLRTRGLPAWGATLAAAPTLFDSRQIWLESSILPDTHVPFREIAGAMGRHLNIPTTSVAPEDALEHFGFMAHFVALDSPVTATITRKLLGWEPTGPSLLEDLEQDHYYRSV